MIKRTLTEGEIALARLLFQDAIDYSKVVLVFDSFWQKASKAAVAPNGRIYFPKKAQCDDFSAAPVQMQVWFMHEMTHVWQYQRGFSVLWSGMLLFCGGGYFRSKAYRYLQDASQQQIAAFEQLNMEQQAEVVAHYFAAKHLCLTAYAPRLPLLEACIQPFLHHPTWLSLLPHHSRCRSQAQCSQSE